MTLLRPPGGRRLLLCAWVGLAPFLAHGQAETSTRPVEAALPGTREGGWREFRGDARNTGVSYGPAPSFSRVRWRFIAESELLNSPAVAVGVVYFGSRSGRLYAVRAKDGSKIWERLHAGPAEDQSPYSGFSHSSALLLGERLYIGSEDGHLYCVSQATGEMLWRRHLGGTGDSARVWASPKTDGRLIFIGSNAGYLWALDPERGEPRWKTWIGDEIGGSVGVLGSDITITAKDKRLHVVDAGTGAPRWHVELGGSSMSAPALALGCAFVRARGGRAVCVDLVNRSVRWTAELPPTGYAQTSVAHDGERVYVTNAATVTGLGADGGQLWQVRAKAAFDASPVVVGAYVVVAGNDQILRAIDRKTGATVKEMDLGDKLIATPSLVDGVAYVPGYSGTLFAVE